ncbi:hypothetical protein ACFYNO_24630 [Kitasatospora sp. NPDC006697]|uniref:hypothetical protein n=1 Tax=Kitasatospora sp. NPDC006697 TaxID=3364020 RepID=UPI003675D765
MAVQDIAFVELYTRDKVSAVDRLVSATGFTRVADSVAADRSSVLLRRGGAQLVVTSGRGIWRFLDDHGDGVADIAFGCADVARAEAAALAAGAQPAGPDRGLPVFAGFGAVVHTLVPLRALPPGRNWTPVPGPAAGPAVRLDHLAVGLPAAAVPRYARLYRDAFGLDRRDEAAADRVALRAAGGRTLLTLAAADTGPEVRHLAFRTGDGEHPGDLLELAPSTPYAAFERSVPAVR